MTLLDMAEEMSRTNAQEAKVKRIILETPFGENAKPQNILQKFRSFIDIEFLIQEKLRKDARTMYDLAIAVEENLQGKPIRNELTPTKYFGGVNNFLSGHMKEQSPKLFFVYDQQLTETFDQELILDVINYEAKRMKLQLEDRTDFLQMSQGFGISKYNRRNPSTGTYLNIMNTHGFDEHTLR
jgi:hypothetical protein